MRGSILRQGASLRRSRFDGRYAESNLNRTDQPRAGTAAASRAANVAERDGIGSAGMRES
jgi:hypothetical protein